MRLVERQMRNWELSRAQKPVDQPDEPPREVEEFVTICRMMGAGGREVAVELGRRLAWPVFDRDILLAMADDDSLHSRLYEYLDERDVGWLEDTLRVLVEGVVHKGQYFKRLGETVLALARKGRAVFLGRGADLFLPRDRGLRVRVIAPPEHCAQAVAQRENISLALARAEVERVEQERSDFLRRHFGKAADRPTRHDLIFNTAHFTIPEVAELIWQALRLRGVVP